MATKRSASRRGPVHDEAGPAESPGTEPVLDDPAELDERDRTRDPSYRNAYLILPREQYGEDEPVTFSQAVVDRGPRAQPIELIPKERLASNVLQRIGMVDLEKVGPTDVARAQQRPPTARGLFNRHPALGLSTAYFRDEAVFEAAVHELGDDYEFVPNFAMALPPRVRLDDVPATRGRTAPELREWPEASGVDRAHAQGVRGAGVLVGVLDTGIDADHREFEGQAIPFRYVPLFPNDVPSRDVRGFDTEGHGTHVCGIIGGRSVGVAPEASLYVASVIESETTRSSLLRLSAGLDWLLRQFSRPENDQRPAVLNLSLGFLAEPPGDIEAAEFALRVRVMQRLLRTLVAANVLPVVAAGNDGPGKIRLPGGFAEVLAVGAVDFEGRIAAFSGSGRYKAGAPEKPDLAGYGVGVNSSVERDVHGRSIYQRFNGTSMACPYVAAIAALHRCRHPGLTVEQIRERMGEKAAALRAGRSRVGEGLARFAP